MIMINCGCGNKYNKELINIDFNSDSVYVKSYNILKGLPFDNDYADWLYSSNFIEHLTPKQAEEHIKECFRICMNVGGIRIVVPDLEDICMEYIRALNDATIDNSKVNEYDYITIELIDQMTRDYSGGKMQEYWDNCSSEEMEYIKSRHGDIFSNVSSINKNKSFMLTELIKFAKLDLLYYVNVTMSSEE